MPTTSPMEIDSTATASADDQRHARAVDRAGPDVAAELVGAEPVRGARRPQPLERVQPERIGGPQQRREDRAEQQNQQ